MIIFDNSNINMQQYLKESKKFLNLKNIKIKKEIFTELLNTNIINYKDLILQDYYFDFIDKAEQMLNNHEDYEDIEFSLNKIHISDFLEKPVSINSKVYLEFGIFIVELLYYKINYLFSDEIIIVLSYNTNGKFKDCILTFFKKRNNINCNYLNTDYLNKFKNESVAVIVCNNKFII